MSKKHTNVTLVKKQHTNVTLFNLFRKFKASIYVWRQFSNYLIHHLSSANNTIFSPKVSDFSYIRKSRQQDILIHFFYFLLFLSFPGVFLTKIIAIFRIATKLATPGLLEIYVTWKISDDVIFSVYEVTN